MSTETPKDHGVVHVKPDGKVGLKVVGKRLLRAPGK